MTAPNIPLLAKDDISWNSIIDGKEKHYVGGRQANLDHIHLNKPGLKGSYAGRVNAMIRVICAGIYLEKNSPTKAKKEVL